MVINKEKNHLHTHVPKTGGESLRYILVDAGWDSDEMRKKGYGQHTTLVNLSKDPEMVDLFKSFYKTTCIRNPWVHAVSLYRAALSIPSFFRENSFGRNDYKWAKVLTDDEISKLDLSFNRFIKSRYKQKAQSNYMNETELMKFDKIFNYDDYDDMLRFFESKFDVKLNSDYRRNDKRKLKYVIDVDVEKPYQYFYDDECYEIVKRASLKEIRKFNYTF